MKHAFYFEDMCCREFVIQMGEDEFGEFLERRVWNDNIDCGGDEFNQYRAEDDRTNAQLYTWIDSRSKIVAIALPTEKWTEREWSKVDSLEVKSLQALLKWEIEKSRARRLNTAG